MPPGNPLPEIKALIARWSSQMSSAGLGAVQTTLDYSTLQGQSTYAESYLPKQVGCMRYVRRALALPRELLPVVSVGAGPRFCLWGWFYDLAPANGSLIMAVDAVDWSPITTAAEFLDVERILLNGIPPTVIAPSHFPEDFVSPQCGLVGMRTNTFSATGLVLWADGGATKYYWIQ